MLTNRRPVDFQLVINCYQIKLFCLLITAMTDVTSLNSLFSFRGSKILPVVNCHGTIVRCEFDFVVHIMNVFEISVIPYTRI